MTLRKLSEMPEVKVASGNTDIRGWRVRAEDGAAVGQVADLLFDPDQNLVRQVLIRAADGRQVIWPLSRVGFLDVSRTIVLKGLTSDQLASLEAFDAEESKLPHTFELLEDRLRIDKRRVHVGDVTVTRRPVEEEVEQQITLWNDDVQVERHLVDRPAQGDERPVVDGDTIRIPVLAERLVVERRPFVVEEIVLTRRKQPRTETVHEKLRREELVIEEQRDKDEKKGPA